MMSKEGAYSLLETSVTSFDVKSMTMNISSTIMNLNLNSEFTVITDKGNKIEIMFRGQKGIISFENDNTIIFNLGNNSKEALVFSKVK